MLCQCALNARRDLLTALQDMLQIMVHELPAGKGTQITALNFGSTPITETLHLPDIAPGPVVDIINERVEGDLTPEGDFTITLDAYEGLALRVVSTTPML